MATRRQQRLGTAVRAVTEVAQVSSETVTGRSGRSGSVEQVRMDLVLSSLEYVQHSTILNKSKPLIPGVELEITVSGETIQDHWWKSKHPRFSVNLLVSLKPQDKTKTS